MSLWRFRESPDFFFTNVSPKINYLFISNFGSFSWSDETQPLDNVTFHSGLSIIPHVIHYFYNSAFKYFNMLPLHNSKFSALREIIISRATSGGRREIELNSGSLPPIPGGLATLVKGDVINAMTYSLGRDK